MSGAWSIVSDASGTTIGAETIAATFGFTTGAIGIAAIHYR
jgi:hypothetical protein